MENHAVFGTFYVTDYKPWLNYEEATDYRNTIVPIAMMILRWDGKHIIKFQNNNSKGKIGFIGGFVDKEETLEEALHRELKEELHFDTEKFKPRKFEFICSHFIPSRFALFVNLSHKVN